MEDDKRVNYKLDAISKLINNLKLSISGNKDHEELGENNVIVNLDEISQKITELHQMLKSEFDEFEEQHKSESDETQELLAEKFDEIKTELVNIENKLSNIQDHVDAGASRVVAAVNNMKFSNDTKNNAIISALSGLVTKVNENSSNISSLDDRVDDLEND
jgi:hypothetical protein